MMLTIVVFLLSACTKERDLPVQTETVATIRVAFNDESQFDRDFGHAFRFYHPDVMIRLVRRPDIVAMTSTQIMNYLENDQPDILILDRMEYEILSQEGLLTNLYDFVVASKMKLDDFLEPVIEMLRLDAGGNLNGLTPYFRSNVLYYNKDLFDQYDIPYPESHTTWEQVMDTAREFALRGSVENGHYGLYHLIGDNPFILMNIMSESENLSYINADQQIELMNTRIHEFYKMVIEGMRIGAIAPPEDHETFAELFREGRAAMRYNGYHELMDMHMFAQDFDVGVAAEPTHDGLSTSYVSETIFAIPLNSTNKEAAWKLIKFVLGEEFYQLKTRSFIDYGLPAEKKAFDQYLDTTLDKSAFYKNSPIKYSDRKKLLPVPVGGFLSVTKQWSREAAAGNISIDDSLQAIEQELNSRLAGSP